MLIAHTADIHIKNTKYHNQYKIIFDRFYKDLKQRKPDYIVVCGDVVHEKSILSPECIELVFEFLSNLSSISKTIVINGNHDCVLSNLNRQDAITPIVEAINNPNLFYSRQTKQHEFDDVIFHALSLLDKKNWQYASNPNKINVCLYHGSVYGSTTDLGYKLEHCDNRAEMFKVYDYVMMGDIHKRQQITNKPYYYPGSLIQQNFSECQEKGYLLWQVENETSYNTTFIPIENDNPFITLDYKNLTDIKPNSRIRLRVDRTENFNAKQFLNEFKRIFQPEFVQLEFNAQQISQSTIDSTSIRDQDSQQKFIRNFFENDVSEEQLQKLFQLDAIITREILKNDDDARNINWSVKSLKWNNFFKYKENNSIDFENLGGIVGLFGKNFSGKSSIIESLLYAVTNNTLRNIKTNSDIVNQTKNTGNSEIVVCANGIDYKISRTIEKKTGKLTKSSVDITRLFDNKCLNGLDKTSTEKIIKSLFGTIEDFRVTSVSAQNEHLEFINKGSTARKEILAKFLDLDFIEKKYKLTKDKLKTIKVKLEDFSKRNLTQETIELKEQQKKLFVQIQELQNQKEQHKSNNKDSEIKQLESEITLLQVKIKNAYNNIQELKNKIDLLKKVPCGTSFPNCLFIKDAFVAKENIKQYENNLLELKQKQEQKSLQLIQLKEQDEKTIDVEQQIFVLNRQIGFIDGTLNKIEKESIVYESLLKEYGTYDLYVRAMHFNGIPYNIIKQQISTINERISQVLSNLIPFSVYFQCDDKNLDILLEHQDEEPRFIEMCSGSEQTIAALAIRIALSSITCLPKSDILILDEPGTAIDSENMSLFIQILQSLKKYFRIIILISHLDSLKEISDINLEIEQSGIYSHINYPKL